MNIINQHFSQLKKLTQEKKDKTAELYSEISTIEKNMNSQIYAVEKEIEAIKEKYMGFAHDLSISANSCPRSRWGGYLEPSEVDIDENGIRLTWIQEHPYGRDEYDYFSATWDELFEYEKNQLPTETIEVTIN
jgi:predicted phage-related endonuclease